MREEPLRSASTTALDAGARGGCWSLAALIALTAAAVNLVALGGSLVTFPALVILGGLLLIPGLLFRRRPAAGSSPPAPPPPDSRPRT